MNIQDMSIGQNSDIVVLGRLESNYQKRKNQKSQQSWIFFILMAGILSTALISFIIFKASTQKEFKTITLIIFQLNEAQSSLKSLNSLKVIQEKNNYPCILIAANNIQYSEKVKINCIKLFFQPENFNASTLDFFINQVQTQYFFMTTTEWTFSSDSFFSLSIQYMDSFPKISQVLPNQQEFKQLKIGKIFSTGFSFSAGLHRKSDFIKATYSHVAGPLSKINEQTQGIISKFYYQQGLRAIVLNRFNLIKYTDQKQDLQNLNKTKQQKKINKKQSNQGKEIEEFIKKDAQKQINRKKIGDDILKIGQSMQAPPIFDIQRIKQIKQLPFCLILIPGVFQQNQLLQSIKNLKYTNYQTVSLPSQLQNIYSKVKELVLQACLPNTFIVFVNSPLKQNSLNQLNQIHQRKMAWISYYSSSNVFEVFSVLYRIYELLQMNDFDNSNKAFIYNHTTSVMTMGIFQMCSDSKQVVEKQKIIDKGSISYLFVDRNSVVYNRASYFKLLRLSQDIILPIQILQKNKKNIRNLKPNNSLQLTTDNMVRAVQNQEVWYLPQNHTINDIQFDYYDRKYNISQYTPIQKQVRFCLTVLSRNNIQNYRYKKVIDTIVNQKYQNYHIVFIDDVSTDNNMNASIKYFQKVDFPKDRIKFVQNKVRNFGTYNIINAAFSFCDQNDVQMLMDGDDELIGKYAFQVMNSAYQRNPNLWVVYSNYKSNFYQYGRSIKLTQKSHYQIGNRRKLMSTIGVIRSWRVKLIYQIPPAHHKDRQGRWLTTLYDDALQHPLFELSTVNRVQYIKEIMYDYNLKYGDNDNSTPEKQKYRLHLYFYMGSLPPLNPLNSIQDSRPNQSLSQQFRGDKNVKYSQIQSI